MSRLQKYRGNKGDEKFSLSSFPDAPIFSVDICGEPDTGKTHCAATFDNPLFLDTEGKAWIVLKKFKKQYGKDIAWKRVKSFSDIRAGVSWGINNPDIKTIVVDSGSELRDLAANEWLNKKPDKDKVWPKVLWGEVYALVDELEEKVKDAEHYFVVTSRLTDEYHNDSYTGRRIHDGYKKHPWTLSIGLRIQYGIRDQMRKTHFENYRFAKVVKNNFHGQNEEKGVTWNKPYLFDISYQGILNELIQPWHGKEGVPLGKVDEVILEEAEEWINQNEEPIPS